jgi:hypothetical protein
MLLPLQEGAGGGDASAHRAEQELLGSLPVPTVGAGEVQPDDALTPAGSVQAVLEGMIVVKVRAAPTPTPALLRKRQCRSLSLGPSVSPHTVLLSPSGKAGGRAWL